MGALHQMPHDQKWREENEEVSALNGFSPWVDSSCALSAERSKNVYRIGLSAEQTVG